METAHKGRASCVLFEGDFARRHLNVANQTNSRMKHNFVQMNGLVRAYSFCYARVNMYTDIEIAM